MQWIYLLLFVAVLLVPQIIRTDFPAIAEENFESAIIFALGLVGFGIFYFRERVVRKHISEKKKYRREASHASRDLVHSYSYIGEVNRQLEVLKSIAFNMPKTEKVTSKEREKAFDAIFEAITIFARVESATLYFVETKKTNVDERLSLGKEKLRVFSATELLSQKKSIQEYENEVVIRGGRGDHGYAVFLCVSRRNGIDDNLGFLKAILMQALLIFVRSKE